MTQLAEVVLELFGPDDVARARRAVCGLIGDADPDVVEDARLAVSELATNALVHGEPPIVVVARVVQAVLRVEVADRSAATGAPQAASATASGGRGLAIVHSIAHRWGVEARGDGKVVWLEFRLDEPSEGDGTPVELLGVPVEAYLRSQEQLESTLHEVQLMAISDRDGFAAIEAELVLPLRRAMEVFSAARQQGRAEAEAAASAKHRLIDFSWRLPVEAPNAAGVYAVAVADLRRLAHDGVLLTPPPDVEVARLRQWIADQVIGQMVDGKPPSPFV